MAMILWFSKNRRLIENVLLPFIIISLIGVWVPRCIRKGFGAKCGHDEECVAWVDAQDSP
jgi:hypothetical protein